MQKRLFRRSLAALLCVAIVISIGISFTSSSSGAQLGQRALQISDSAASASTRYRLAFSYATPGVVGSIRAQFCANDPLPDTPCTPPVGLDVSQVVLNSQSGVGGFSVSSATNANQIVLTRSPGAVSPGGSVYEFIGAKNPSVPGSYYVRLQTYASTNATGVATDYGGIAFAINNNLTITATVPPYLIFCTGTQILNLNCAQASGDFVDFGELSASRASVGTSKMLVATNAASGYNITYQGGTLTSGNNVINAITNGDVSKPGTSQFGLNLRSNSTPGAGANPVGPGQNQPKADYNQPNLYRFVSGDSLVSYPKPDDVRQYTSTYMANIPRGQAAGIYVSTITYICLANF